MPNKTPAQERRSKLAEAIRARGERANNIWLVRPPFERRDLILGSDPQFESFYLIEGEPAFLEIQYSPRWYEPKDEDSERASNFATVTTLERDQVQIHLAFGKESRVKGGQAISLTPIDGVVCIDLRLLDAHRQRVENWRRVIPCIRRVALHATSGIERQIALVQQREGRCTLAKLQSHFYDLEAAVFYGAVAILLRKRELQSDLDSRPWSTHTLLWGPQ